MVVAIACVYLSTTPFHNTIQDCAELQHSFSLEKFDKITFKILLSVAGP